MFKSLYGQPSKLKANLKELVNFSIYSILSEHREDYFHIEDYAPFEEDDESKLIKDVHSKLIYLVI